MSCPYRVVVCLELCNQEDTSQQCSSGRREWHARQPTVEPLHELETEYHLGKGTAAAAKVILVAENGDVTCVDTRQT